QAIGRREFEAVPYAVGHIGRSFDKIALHIYDADRHIRALRDLRNDVDFGKFAAGHFEVHLITFEIEKGREHRSQTSRAYGARLVIAETKMSADTRAAGNGLNCAIENIDEAFCILAVGIAAHGWFINAKLLASGTH